MNNIINVYKKLYNLPILSYSENVSSDFFKACQKDHRFVVISIYNKNNEFLLIRDLNKNIGWELVGGYLQKMERMEDAVNRIVARETGFSIDELQPVVFIKNNFKYANRNICHSGIGFVASVRGKIKKKNHNITLFFTRKIPDRMAYQNKSVLYKSLELLNNRKYKIPYKEIESVKRCFLFYCVNKYIIKPLLGNFASRKINKKILSLVRGKPKSIIDVSCGDDELLSKLEKFYRPSICIGNDISYKTISLLSQKRKKKSNILFTNHNVLNLPFKNKFDLVICKNTLHHIEANQKIELIKKLCSIAKQLIIIDIDNPRCSTFFAKLWNKYYCFCLGDQGGSFLTFKEFKNMLNSNTEKKKINYGVINTIKGNYFYTSLVE